MIASRRQGLSTTVLLATAFLWSQACGQAAGTLSTTAAANLGNAGNTQSAVDLPLDQNQAIPQPVNVVIKVRIPHNQGVVDNFTVYPYPVKPPAVIKPVAPLNTDPKALRGQLLNVGYSNTGNERYAWISGGWRFRYAFDYARKKSHLGYPHTIFTSRGWAEDMVKYMLPAVKAINEAEKNRCDCYKRVCDIFDNDGPELESEASRNGLFPSEFLFNKNGVSTVKLLPGKWWVTGTRKVLALTYYWELPVTIPPGPRADVTLTEANALLVQGASW